jgi:hypothetical protein
LKARCFNRRTKEKRPKRQNSAFISNGLKYNVIVTVVAKLKAATAAT